MLLNFCVVYFLIIFSGAAKLGVGNGRPSEEPSSLKTEVMKFKTEECGGSSEEQNNNNNKRNKKNRHKEESEESESSDSDEDDRKKKKPKRKHNSRGSYRMEMDSSTFYFDYNKNFERMRPQFDDFNIHRQDSFQNRWDPNRYPSQGNQYPTNMEDDASYQSGGNRRNQNNRYDPYNFQPEYSYSSTDSRDDNRFPHRNDDRYSNRDDDRYYNRYPNRNDDRYSSRNNRHNRRNQNRNNQDDSSEHNRKQGQRRTNRRNNNNNKKGKGRKKKDEDECVSQCVFNNMQIIEDDGIPSEAAMIKWAQDNIKNEKLKAAGVKEIRKCFGNLASSDGENSCNFSKSLSSCLKLDLDEDDE